MVLIDALYINIGGGKVLLDYIINELEKTNNKIFYLFDSRIKNNHPFIKQANEVLYLKASLWNRRDFYLKNKDFKKIFCLGNIPPTRKLSGEVFTYFHNSLFLNVPDGFSYKEKLKYFLKVIVIKVLKNNTDYWWVQTDLIQKLFIEKYSENIEKVHLMPFYPPFDLSNNKKIVRKIHTYIYVSNATPNKNHVRLLDAFCNFYETYKVGKLIVTVNNDYPKIIEEINSRITNGYPIENIGFIKRNDIKELYLSTEYLVFPSLAESFGLGIVEAIENGCKIIGADLPYTYAVCEPSLTFDAMSSDSIYKAFEESILNNHKLSVSRIDNKIINIISTLLK